MYNILKTIIERITSLEGGSGGGGLSFDIKNLGMLLGVGPDGTPSAKDGYDNFNNENDGFGVYRYDDAVSAGNSFTSKKLRRSGIHYLRFDTTVLANAPRAWATGVYATNNYATLIVFGTGGFGEGFRLLAPCDVRTMFISNTEDYSSSPVKIEWFEMPGPQSIQNPSYAVQTVRDTEHNNIQLQYTPWFSNRKTAAPLGTHAYSANKMYLTPMRFPHNLRINKIAMDVTARSKITAGDEVYLCIYESHPWEMNPGRVVGYAKVLMDTWPNSTYEGDVYNRIGERKSIDVSSHLVYWVGFVVFSTDATTLVTARTLPAADTPIICGGSYSNEPFSATPLTAFVQNFEFRGNIPSQFMQNVGMEHMQALPVPALSFKPVLKNTPS